MLSTYDFIKIFIITFVAGYAGALTLIITFACSRNIHRFAINRITGLQFIDISQFRGRGSLIQNASTGSMYESDEDVTQEIPDPL